MVGLGQDPLAHLSASGFLCLLFSSSFFSKGCLLRGVEVAGVARWEEIRANNVAPLFPVKICSAEICCTVFWCHFSLAFVTFRRCPSSNLSASLYLPATCRSLAVQSLQTKRDLSRNLDQKKCFHSISFLQLCKCYQSGFFFSFLAKTHRSSASIKFAELPE